MGAPKATVPDGQHSVDSMMRLWPATIRVFLDYRMQCVGCPVGRLHTIEEACREHGVDPAAFLDDLRAAAGMPHACSSGPDD